MSLLGANRVELRTNGFGFEWTGENWSSKHIPFDWSGPDPAKNAPGAGQDDHENVGLLRLRSACLTWHWSSTWLSGECGMCGDEKHGDGESARKTEGSAYFAGILGDSLTGCFCLWILWILITLPFTVAIASGHTNQRTTAILSGQECPLWDNADNAGSINHPREDRNPGESRLDAQLPQGSVRRKVDTWSRVNEFAI